MASVAVSVLEMKRNGQGETMANVLDVLEAFVGYFDGKGPLSQRAQIATKALPEARKLLGITRHASNL